MFGVRGLILPKLWFWLSIIVVFWKVVALVEGGGSVWPEDVV
jgi:hypothetical protein